MKKWLLAVPVLAVASLVVAGEVEHASAISTAQPIPLTSETQHNLARLQESQIKFDTPMQQPGITPEQAKQIAASTVPGYAAEAKSVVVEYHLLTDPSMQMFSADEKQKNSQVARDGYLKGTPCYIVSYEGLTLVPKGVFPGHKPVKNNTELNVVIDANTGIALFTFDYR